MCVKVREWALPVAQTEDAAAHIGGTFGVKNSIFFKKKDSKGTFAERMAKVREAREAEEAESEEEAEAEDGGDEAPSVVVAVRRARQTLSGHNGPVSCCVYYHGGRRIARSPLHPLHPTP